MRLALGCGITFESAARDSSNGLPFLWLFVSRLFLASPATFLSRLCSWFCGSIKSTRRFLSRSSLSTLRLFRLRRYCGLLLRVHDDGLLGVLEMFVRSLDRMHLALVFAFVVEFLDAAARRRVCPLLEDFSE